jgi:asparaginyl-tRNA synthetase
LISEDAEKWIGKSIVVGGWARSTRKADGGKILFIELNDGSSFKSLQIVVNSDLSNFLDVEREGIGSCFQIKGKVVKSLGGKQKVKKI